MVSFLGMIILIKLQLRQIGLQGLLKDIAVMLMISPHENLCIVV